MITSVCLVMAALQTVPAPSVALLPLTFDGAFSEADTTPLRNSLRHALKANLKPLGVRELTSAEIAKSGLKGVALPFSLSNLDKVRTTFSVPAVLQVRVTACSIKMQVGASKPTFNASMKASYWLSPVPKGAAVPSEISITTSATSILMDKPTMHKVCGLIMKELASKIKPSLTVIK
ncbi:MAG TPA: hypothetical protein VK171_05650 [Fimbriimonas sp.]|nr:hypothetical protein [Fimbriimonas sp.]